MINNKTYNPLINPGTGDYVITNGDTVQDFTTQFPAYVRLKVQRKRWLYAPDDNYGSDFYKIMKRGNNVPHMLESIATKALQPLIDDGRVVDIDVFGKPISRNNCSLAITIQETKQLIQTFEFSPVV